MHTSQKRSASSWMRDISLFASLRTDDAGRLIDAARRVSSAPGEVIYDVGASATRAYVLLSGSVRLEATPRGEVNAIVLRQILKGEAFGLEAAFGARTRHVRAVVESAAELLELPAELLARSVRRSDANTARQLERAVRRKLTDEQLRTMAFTRALPDGERELLLDMVRRRHADRGDAIYRESQRADAMYLVASGMVRLFHTVDGERHIRAYLSAGDFFGETEAMGHERYRLGAEAVGPCELLVLAREHLLTLTARNPGLLEQMQRIAFQREEVQTEALVHTATSSDHTQHLFHDIYRAALATELLAINLDRCVSCGTCAWSCHETHGQARLVRRGDKVIAPAGLRQIAPETRLLLPNSCQHCRDPECMIDCPTGAIGRDPEGEVFIRAEICTGCEACAKACPWDNIQIAPAPPESAFSRVAIKCDLCRGHEGVSACVANCPTGAIVRLDPRGESAALGAMLGTHSGDVVREVTSAPETSASLKARIIAGLVGVGLLAGSGIVAHLRGTLVPYVGIGLWSGLLAVVVMLGLAAFGLRKRGIRVWMKRLRVRETGVSAHHQGAKAPESTSKKARKLVPLSRWYSAHLVLGAVLVALVSMHTGWGGGGPLTQGLMLSLVGATLLGAGGAFLYRWLPPRLTRVVAQPHLPEDFEAESRRLQHALTETLSGRDEARAQVQSTLSSLWTSPGAVLGVILKGADRHALREAYAARVRGSRKWDVSTDYALEKSARLTAELVGLRAERLGHRVLAVWLLPHVLCSLVALVLVLVHAVLGLAWL